MPEPSDIAAPKVVTAPNIPTLRATEILVSFDGGAFQVNLFDARPIVTNAESTAIQQALFEIGRFALSPAALDKLGEQIARAKATYAAALGHPYPDTTVFDANIAIRALTDRIRPPNT